MSSGEWKRLTKFSIVGLSGMLVNETLLWALTEVIGLFYLLSSALSAEAAILNNFLWNDIWTFKDDSERRHQNLLRKLLKFHVTRLGGLTIGVVFIGFFTEIIKIHYLISNVLSILLVMIYNYVTSKGLVWD